VGTLQGRQLEGIMFKKITLPSGNTVNLRDPKDLRQKDRRKVLEQGGAFDNQVLASLSIIEGMIAVLVESWSFDLIPPSVRIESLGELTMADYDVLVEEAKEAEKVLFPAVAKTYESESNPDSPFGKSNA
jgi:hypothetical protein